MEVKAYKPRNSVLSRYIECFYTLKCTSEEKNTTYISFPSIFSMVCLNAKSVIESRDEKFTFTHNPNALLKASLFCNFDHVSWNTYQAKADEIVIYFKPLGINAFIEKALKHYIEGSFVEFNPFEDYRPRMEEILAIGKDKDRIAALEDYWISKYQGFRHPFLHQVVDELLGEDNSCPLAHQALKHRISRATLNKHFDLHLCTTPSQFKKVVRFRNAMTRFTHKSSQENLADISYCVDYFDQSHMIKDFRSLTQYSPKTFFSKISTLEDGQINWLFL